MANSLKVTKFFVRSFDLDHLDLFWEIEDFVPKAAHDVVSAYDIYVQRSESQGGPWDTLAGPFKDQYRFRDFSPNLLHKWRQLYYRLRVVHVPSSTEEFFGVASHEAEPDLIALEIQRQEDLLFREYSGRRGWLFPVRTFGQRCSCFDPRMGRRTRSNCLTCFDTGFCFGFLSPLEQYIQLDPNPEHPQQTSVHGEKQPKNTSMRLMAFPRVKPKDILVEAENKRWEVVTVTGTERLRARVHQEVTLHQIPKNDIRYKLPINLTELENQQWANERNFTNPQHVDPHGDLEDILAVYGYRPRGTQG